MSQPPPARTTRRRRDRGTLPPELRAELLARQKALRLTNADLAEAAGLHPSEVTRLHKGQRGLSVAEAVVLASLLDWHPVKLLPGAPALAEPTPELPVYRWASCGDPRDRETMDDPDHEEPAPFGQRDKIGPNGFGIMVHGESMTAREIWPLDVVWVNPDEPGRINRAVLARAWGASDEELGLVVKVLGYLPGTTTPVLFSDRLGADDRPVGPELFAEAARHEVIGPAVWVSCGHPPGGPRSVSDIRPGHVSALPPKAVGPR